jgi:hypothetical protein
MKLAADIRQHIDNLDRAGLLMRMGLEINKDTEVHPIVRWQYPGGIPEEKRKAFLFETVVDSKGKRYETPQPGRRTCRFAFDLCDRHGLRAGRDSSPMGKCLREPVLWLFTWPVRRDYYVTGEKLAQRRIKVGP